MLNTHFRGKAMNLPKFPVVIATGVLISTLACAKSLNDQFLYSTVFIKNQSAGKTGTGFLVQRKISETKIAIYLFSNKHVLAAPPIDPMQKNLLARAEIHINRSMSSKVQKDILRVALRNNRGQTFVKVHPNKNVDVAAINVSNAIKGPPRSLHAIPEERFATREFIDANFVSVGDQALIVGYPLNLVEQGHVIPIVRNGIIATHPNRSFQNLPLFLVDATVLRGSSGSPVILPVRPYVWTEENKVSIGKIQQNHLLGIAQGHINDWQMVIRRTVALGRAQEFTVVDNSQLGLVFPADRLVEVMDLFPLKKWTGEETKEAPQG